MQKDFHYATVYVLCRLAGMKSKYAKKVAYSSQQVDDAVYGHALNLIMVEFLDRLKLLTSYYPNPV